MPSNADITQDFINAWTEMNIDQLMGFFTEDAAYANVPMGPPHIGKNAIREFIESFMTMASEMEFIVHNQIEGQDGMVMNERTDRLCLNGKWVELPVMGVFEFRDGKISAWRDYFDMGKFTE